MGDITATGSSSDSKNTSKKIFTGKKSSFLSPFYKSSKKKKKEEESRGDEDSDSSKSDTNLNDGNATTGPRKVFSKTSILQHSFCHEKNSDGVGDGRKYYDDNLCLATSAKNLPSTDNIVLKKKKRQNSLDMTSTETIECVFQMSLEGDPYSHLTPMLDYSLLSENNSFGDESAGPPQQPENATQFDRNDKQSNISQRGRIVHVADIMHTERDSIDFVAAYENYRQPYYDKDGDSNSNATIKKTISNSSQTAVESSSKSSNPRSQLCCFCSSRPRRDLPPIAPKEWPQRPLLLRATPGMGTRILGIRFCSSTSYLSSPWPHALSSDWGSNNNGDHTTSLGMEYTCTQCQILPVNNGTEAAGKSLVIDFETDLFIGTLLMRIRDSNGTTPQDNKSSNDYFGGMNRKYQAVIRGEFKKSVSTSSCITGQLFHKPCRLPSKWVLRTAIGIISLFAPRLQAKLDGGYSTTDDSKCVEEEKEEDSVVKVDGPTFLSPLGSAPQVMIARSLGTRSLPSSSLSDGTSSSSTDKATSTESQRIRRHQSDASMEANIEEPFDPKLNLVSRYHKQLVGTEVPAPMEKKGNLCGAGLPKNVAILSSQSRAKIRKKHFDKLSANDDKVSRFEPNTIYTFEFLQHLINFDSFKLDVSGGLGLTDMLKGQPLKFMAALQDKNVTQEDVSLKTLWSFDIWHESLYRDAEIEDKRISEMNSK